jgi:hypothetical protein
MASPSQITSRFRSGRTRHDLRFNVILEPPLNGKRVLRQQGCTPTRSQQVER